jgi:hypothetical protein
MTKRCTIMRSPCLMEDEGRSHLVKICESVEEAQQWIERQRGQYFGPEDYYIMQPLEDGSVRYTVKP